MSAPVALQDASVAELLAELARRFDEPLPLPSWAAPVVSSVAAHYRLRLAAVRAGRRRQEAVQARHLCISLLARLHPHRSRAEVCAVVGLAHEMYAHALARTEQRLSRFPSFRADVASILAALPSHGHCRTSPQAEIDCTGKSA